MPALDYSYLVLHDDLDKKHTVAEIESYNKRLKELMFGLFGIQNFAQHSPTDDGYLKDIAFEFSLRMVYKSTPTEILPA